MLVLSTTEYLTADCLESSSKDWIGVFILSTVKKAAKFAVKVASINTTNNQYAATRQRADTDLGVSPPPIFQEK